MLPFRVYFRQTWDQSRHIHMESFPPQTISRSSCLDSASGAAQQPRVLLVDSMITLPFREKNYSTCRSISPRRLCPPAHYCSLSYFCHKIFSEMALASEQPCKSSGECTLEILDHESTKGCYSSHKPLSPALWWCTMRDMRKTGAKPSSQPETAERQPQRSHRAHPRQSKNLQLLPMQPNAVDAVERCPFSIAPQARCRHHHLERCHVKRRRVPTVCDSKGLTEVGILDRRDSGLTGAGEFKTAMSSRSRQSGQSSRVFGPS
jgi:hypothetical protein